MDYDGTLVGYNQEPELAIPDESLIDILQKDGATDEFLENTRLELSHDQVYCFTPKGRLIALPQDSTALDFAFALHTDLGLFCSGVKINGEKKPRRTKLKNGDEVEIIKSKSEVPLDSYEDLVTTGRSKSSIRRAIKENTIKNQRLLGKEIIKSVFSSHRKKPTRDILERSFGPLNVKSLMDLYQLVGSGKSSGSEVYDHVYPKTKRKTKRKRYYSKNISLQISGLLPDMDVSFQKNSLLVPGDNIIGITIPGKGITIYHAKDEELHKHENSPERWLRLQWKKEIDVTFTARLVNQDGDADGELDVTIGAGTSSLTTLAGNAKVTGNTLTFGSGATIVNTNASLLTITEATTAFSGIVTTTGNATVGGALTVTGNTELNGNVDIGDSDSRVGFFGNATVVKQTETLITVQPANQPGGLANGLGSTSGVPGITDGSNIDYTNDFIKNTTEFGYGYTIEQIVQALVNYGILNGAVQ